MKRMGTIAVLGAVALAGCQNMGLEYAGPEGDAVVAPPTALVAAVHPRTAAGDRQQLIVDGRNWVPSGRPLALSESDLSPVGSAGGHTVYARSWDDAPYDALFTRTDGSTWVSYLPVIGGGRGAGEPSGAHGGAGAAAGH